MREIPQVDKIVFDSTRRTSALRNTQPQWAPEEIREYRHDVDAKRHRLLEDPDFRLDHDNARVDISAIDHFRTIRDQHTSLLGLYVQGQTLRKLVVRSDFTD